MNLKMSSLSISFADDESGTRRIIYIHRQSKGCDQTQGREQDSGEKLRQLILIHEFLSVPIYSIVSQKIKHEKKRVWSIDRTTIAK
jgi:dsRNA-specific ribonuclease